MNKLAHLLLVASLACLPILTIAQESKAQYLSGAVPVVDGKVVFSREFSIPGMSQEQIYERMMNWMTERLKKNNSTNSRVVYSDETQGSIAGMGQEWIVFKSSALSLDRTLISYQITATCEPGKCVIAIEKIRYLYGEKEKYTAEDWITDKYALNKAQTKMVRGLAKWRTKTVDFANDLFEGAALALGAPQTKPEAKKVEKKAAIITGPVVINTGTPVTVTTKPEVIPAIPLTPATPVAAGEMPGYTAVAPDKIPADAIQMSAGKLVIAIGSDAFNMTMMTANAGGSLGKMAGKPVVFCFLSPDQPYDQIEKAETYAVRFYTGNQTEPSIILECKKLPSQAPLEGQPRMYVGEILKAWIKK